MNPHRRATKLRQQHVHFYVAETAKSAALEHYEILMGAMNELYAEWKRQHPGMSAKALQAAYVKRHWGKYVELARATLARILATSSDERLKETIYEALLLDNTLIRGRGKPFQSKYE